jgi:hypothetical protein
VAEYRIGAGTPPAAAFALRRLNTLARELAPMPAFFGESLILAE